MKMKQAIQFLKQLQKRIMDADVFGLAAQLAYFFLLSLFPFLLFLVTLVGYMPIDEDYLLSFLDTYAPTEIMSLIESNLTRIVNVQNGSLLSIGRSEEHTSELQSRGHLVCRLLLEKKKRKMMS